LIILRQVALENPQVILRLQLWQEAAAELHLQSATVADGIAALAQELVV
jgi:hypothetical protein